MYPTYNPGDLLQFNTINKRNTDSIKVNDLVVFYHPYKNAVKLLKRVKKIVNSTSFFVEGDNPDPNSSEDSHNFGLIQSDKIIAFKKEFACL